MQDAEVTILRELIILLAVSLPITFLFHKAKLPALVGFLITGVLIGPHGTAVITETQAVERLADIGVVLLLFTVGHEFSIEDIERSGRRSPVYLANDRSAHLRPRLPAAGGVRPPGSRVGARDPRRPV